MTIKNGIATVVRERHDADNGTDNGVNATCVSNDTAVHGADTVCRSPMSEARPRSSS